MKPKISLIITVYNKAPYLRRCLDSIANQTNKEAEVWIIDDCSTDGSADICDEYGEKYKWVVIHNAVNKGVSEARNIGLDNAKGDYVAFLDADDAFVPEAIETMTQIARHDYNIYQFGQIRCKSGDTLTTTYDKVVKGRFGLDRTPRRWPIVWNKLYKKSFLDSLGVRFKEGMNFGEDEIFNVTCLLANNGLYHAPQTLMEHYFDDRDSLCRGGLNLARLKRLESELIKVRDEQSDPAKKQWVNSVIERHRRSDLFKKYGYQFRGLGQYDIVYFVKNEPKNEELRYSLRSVEENLKYRNVWFYGGCPEGLTPDRHIKVSQDQPSKWERVRNMLRQACENDELTEDFWLFNDDFFILKPMSENMPPQYNDTLYKQIVHVEGRHGERATVYTTRLRHLVKTLEKAKKDCLNYAVHKPILINRKKMLEVLDKFPDEPMSRALYGNYWQIGGVSKHDMKIETLEYAKMETVKRTWDFVSTSDKSFENGTIGAYLKQKFNKKSRFEV